MPNDRRPRSVCGGYCVDGAFRGAVVGLTWATVHGTEKYFLDNLIFFADPTFVRRPAAPRIFCALVIYMFRFLPIRL